jgi:hypothetical protein
MLINPGCNNSPSLPSEIGLSNIEMVAQRARRQVDVGLKHPWLHRDFPSFPTRRMKIRPNSIRISSFLLFPTWRPGGAKSHTPLGPKIEATVRIAPKQYQPCTQLYGKSPRSCFPFGKGRLRATVAALCSLLQVVRIQHSGNPGCGDLKTYQPATEQF